MIEDSIEQCPKYSTNVLVCKWLSNNLRKALGFTWKPNLLHPTGGLAIMLSHGATPVIVAGMLGHSISILLNTYAHFIPTMQDQAAQLMDNILTPIPIELQPTTKST